MMVRPEMIIFDYGHTLLYEPGFDGVRGMESVLRHAVSNPRGYTAGQVERLLLQIYERAGDARRHGLELSQHAQQRLVFEYLEIEIGLSHEEIERVFWDNAAPGSPMPYIKELLAYLQEKGIRTAVISNIGFSGAALAERINRLLPENRFEFIMASSEYMLRKPEPMLFELALRKAGLPGESVWYCGDTVRYDADGAHRAGLFPVWYDSGHDREYYNVTEQPPEYRHLRVKDWRELIGKLDAMQG